MKTFRRITLLCCFAMVGLGLAVCVGFSTAPPVDEQESEPQKPAAELATRPQSEAEPVSQPPRDVDKQEEEPLSQPPAGDEEPLSQPPPRAADLVPPWPTLPVPSSPLPAEPYPARTQQFIPAMGKARLEEIYESVKQQLTPDSTTTATEDTPEVPTADDREKPPAAAAGPEPEPPAPKATIDGEGDGKLLIHIPPDTDIREVLEQLADYGDLNILASSGVQGKVSATLRGVGIEGALDAILRSTGLVARREGKFIFVGTPADFDNLEQAMDKVGTRVYRPNYVTAAELQTLIQPLLSDTVGKMSISSPAESGIETDDSSAGGDNFAGGDALVVRDYEAVLTEIDQVVDEIDIRPMQVAIEAMILGVVLDDGNDFGVNFEFLRNKDHAKLGWGIVPENKEALEESETILNDTVDTATLAAIGGLSKVLLDGGLKFGFLDDNLGVFLNALESIGDTNVIATPRLLVLNKQRAEIHIGGEEGYRGSVSSTETSTTQDISMLETGTRLRLRPFISSDGMIRMEVHPELSSGEVQVIGNDVLPVKRTTQVTTNVMVRDGCTVVIGGLLDEELVTTTTQIPLLGSLPVVGVVFRNKSESIHRREIIVLITPHIVYEPGTCREGDKAAAEFHRRQAVYADHMSPVGKRSVARRYFRMAQDARATGQPRQALRFIDLSVHFDPLNRAAIDLQSDIWAGSQHGEHTLGADALAGPFGGASSGPTDGRPLSPIDGETIPGWLLEDLEHEPTAQSAPLHPLDPGRPGSRTDVVRPRRLR